MPESIPATELTANHAFVLAIGEMQNPPKNKRVEVPGRYSFEYADLGSIMSVVKPGLAKYGLCVVQPIRQEGGQIIINTQIIHTSGTVVVEMSLAARDPVQPQAQGSLITYLRRYSVCSLLGIVADDDDDGNTAQGQDARVSDRAPKAAPAPAPPPRPLPADFLDWCKANNLKPAHVDTWTRASEKGSIYEYDEARLAKMVSALDGKAELLGKIRGAL